MTVCTCIGRNRGAAGVRPGILAGAVPGRGGSRMLRGRPRIGRVASQTKSGGGVFLNQKLPVQIVVRIVAGSALDLTAPVQADFFEERRRIAQLTLRRGQRTVVS